MSFPSTGLNLSTFVVNSLNLKEQLQNIELRAENTEVDGRGIADRYPAPQATKQKQTINFMANWFNSDTSLEATNLDISLWTLGSTAYLADVKSGSIDVSNTGPDVSGIAAAYEAPLPTYTPITITTDMMVVAEAYFTYTLMTGASIDFYGTVAITFAGEAFTCDAFVKGSVHSVKRGEVQMENVTMTLDGAPATTGDTTSLLYMAAVGSAVVTFSTNTGANTYANQTSQTAVLTKMNLKFADKELIEQSVTLDVQGAMEVTAG